MEKRQRESPSSYLMGDLDLVGISDIQNEGKSPILENGANAGMCACLFEKRVVAPVAAFIIGILCSLLGIGGGELMGPLMLSLGFLPQVTSATTSAMSLMNSALNIVHYMIIGELDGKWALYLFFTGLVGGVAGRKLSIYVSSTWGRPSVTVFMLGIILFFSVFLMVDQLMEPGTDFTTWSKLCGMNVTLR